MRAVSLSVPASSNAFAFVFLIMSIYAILSVHFFGSYDDMQARRPAPARSSRATSPQQPTLPPPPPFPPHPPDSSPPPSSPSRPTPALSRSRPAVDFSRLAPAPRSCGLDGRLPPVAPHTIRTTTLARRVAHACLRLKQARPVVAVTGGAGCEM